MRFGQENGVGRLSVIDAKTELYRQETYSREALAAIKRCTDESVVDFALRHAAVILRPETVVTRRLEECDALLRQCGFEAVAMRPFTFDRHMTRALWRYKLNIATLQRLEIVDLIQEAAPSLLVLVRDVSGSDALPASVRLTSHKGPSDPRRREPHHIRARLGVQNRLLNFLHTSDEPADLVRELAILFDAPELECLLGDVGGDRHSLRDTAQRLYAEQAFHDLRFETSLERVRELALSAAVTDDQRAHLAGLDPTVGIPSNDRWGSVLHVIRSMKLPVDRWDFITIGAHLVEPDTATGRRILGDASCEAWRKAAATGAGAGRRSSGDDKP